MKTWIEEAFHEGERQFDDCTNEYIVQQVLSKFRDEVEKRFMKTPVAVKRSQIMNEILREIGL